jgi:hypothetical protein
MKAVGAFAEDIQEQVDLAGRFQAQAHSEKRNAPTKNGWRVRQNMFSNQINCRKSGSGFRE